MPRKKRMPKETQGSDKPNKTGKAKEKRPVDVIREMNPGVWIPTGAELAKILKKKPTREEFAEIQRRKNKEAEGS